MKLIFKTIQKANKILKKNALNKKYFKQYIEHPLLI